MSCMSACKRTTGVVDNKNRENRDGDDKRGEEPGDETADTDGCHADDVRNDGHGNGAGQKS